ncbi:MAG: hypothetical protein ACRCTJ_00605 [Brevinema sp.]
MHFFKILGLILSLSPIVFNHQDYFLPYSFFGMTMYVLALLFGDEENEFQKLIFAVYWSISFYYILVSSPLLYHIICLFMLISYFIFQGLRTEKHSILSIVGIISTTIGMFIPIATMIGILIATIIEILSLVCLKKNRKYSQPILIEDIPLEQNIEEIFQAENLSISLIIEEKKAEERDYVIPYE